MPKFLGLRRQAKERGDFKSLNENLAPLRRYLEGQLGRPWNKVYSEMRARIDFGNTVQAHVLTHVEQFIHRVVTKVVPGPTAPCGLLYQREVWGGRFQAVREGDLYVDPDDGIIKRARRRLRTSAKPAPEPGVRRLGPDLAAIRVQGVWYAADLVDDWSGTMPYVVWFSGRPSLSRHEPPLGSVWGSELWEVPGVVELCTARKLPISKRQLSSRELRRYGLSNLSAD